MKIAIFGAVANALNLVLLSGTRPEKRHPLLIAISRDLKYFDDVELVFPIDKFKFVQSSTCSQKTKNKPWLPVANTETGFVLVFSIYGRSNKLESYQVVLASLCLKN